MQMVCERQTDRPTDRPTDNATYRPPGGGKKSRKRGYGPPTFVCLACDIHFMQKEDIFCIFPL